ncbi:SCR-like protein [Medicago truncatula]|uniref:SCR-like protein n=1 Tax=Medicago truncatula TaxID=3880 RepID=A0A072TX87_MEDTR|nr:SCR-like protein [Medicago truncatula]
MMKRGIILQMMVALFALFNHTYASIEDEINKCSRGLILPGLCSQGCTDAVRKKHRVTPTSCSCNDTPIRVAFCTCNIICESVKEKKVLS